MALIAGAIVGTSLVGGYFQNKGAKEAAQTTANAANQASQLEYQQFQQTREDMAPWREAGSRALGGLQDMLYGDPQAQMEKLRSTPGYQFRLDEGLRALQRTSLAGSVSGNTYRDLVKYGQDYASNEFTNRYNRLAGLAGTGQDTAQYLGGLGSQVAGRRGGYLQDAAGAQASYQLGRGKLIGSTLGSLASMGTGFMSKPTGGNLAAGGNYYASDYVGPRGSFGTNPYAGAGGYGDNWTDY